MTLAELAGLGKVTKEIEPLKDLKIKVHSLTVKEEEEIYASLSKVSDDALVKTSALQIETLARAIETINGEKFTDVKILSDYLKTIQRHVLSVIWQAWMKDIEEQSVQDLASLKKNSVTPKAA